MTEGVPIDNLKVPFELNRQKVKVQLAEFVALGETIFRIEQVLDFESVIGVDVVTGRSKLLRIAELQPAPKDSIKQLMANLDMAAIADEDWRVAEERYAAIKPLLSPTTGGRKDVETRAKEINVNASTLYRWLKRFTAYGTISALIPHQRGWKTGKARIPYLQEAVIQEVINNFYLTHQRFTVSQTVIEVKRCCLKKNLEPPSYNTVRTRISSINARLQLSRRGQREKAKNKYLPVPGKFPGADYPLAVVQIDHTPADLIIVDDVHRRPIGRPWITMAIDVFSRMVVGYYLSFDEPSETSLAMCVSNLVIPKDEVLLLHGIDAQWPVWGFPKTIHVDNGSDFRSNTFQKSCTAYGINLEFRPVKTPRYGGHIERLLGTFLQDIHTLPGTTFSSIKERDGYDSEKHASMTKGELEKWLLTQICKVYHARIHSSIGMTPLKKWEIGIFGNAETHGVGLPARPTDRLTVLLDFLPSFSRTIQTTGVTIDALSYYAEALRPWINAEDPEQPGKKWMFIFRRDPRDISALWFYDPELKQYFKIPLADQSLPSISIWEYRQVREKLRREGHEGFNEHQLMRAISELREQVASAATKTKKARYQSQRRADHTKSSANKVAQEKIEKNSVDKFQTVPVLLSGNVIPETDIS